MVYNKLFFVFFIFVISITFVNAFGVGSLYSMNNPLVMSPGETKDVQVFIQSAVPVTTSVNINSEANIASLVSDKKINDITPSEKAILNLSIKVPKNAKFGTEYNVSVFVTDVTPSTNEGTVSLKTAINYEFKVIIKNETNSDKSSSFNLDLNNLKGYGIVILGVIILILIVVLIMAIIYFNQMQKNKKRYI